MVSVRPDVDPGRCIVAEQAVRPGIRRHDGSRAAGHYRIGACGQGVYAVR